MRAVRITREGRGHGCAVAAAIVIALAGAAILALHLYDRHWQGEVEGRLAEYRAAGQPVTWEGIVARRRSVAGEQTSAAGLFRAFGELERAETPYDGRVLYGVAFAVERGARHSPALSRILEEHLGACQEALGTIRNAVELPPGAYPLDETEHPFEARMAHLDPLREAGRLCAMAAVYRAGKGEAEATARNTLDGLRLGRSIGDTPLAAESTVCLALDRTAVGSVRRSLELCEMPAVELQLLRQAIGVEARSVSLRGAFVSARAAAHKAFFEPWPEGFGRQVWGEPDWRTRILSRSYALLGGWRKQDALLYYRAMEDYLEACDLPTREALELAEESEKLVRTRLRRHPIRHCVSAWLLSALPDLLHERVRTETGLRVAEAALAVEEWRIMYRRWPDSLEELVPELLGEVPEDPFSEGKVRYARTPDGVVVYSVGPDGQDDGGYSRKDVSEQTGNERPMEGFDIAFRLLGAEFRGATTATLKDELAASGLEYYDLDYAGFTREKLLELGLTEEDLDDLGFPKAR